MTTLSFLYLEPSGPEVQKIRGLPLSKPIKEDGSNNEIFAVLSSTYAASSEGSPSGPAPPALTRQVPPPPPPAGGRAATLYRLPFSAPWPRPLLPGPAPAPPPPLPRPRPLLQAPPRPRPRPLLPGPAPTPLPPMLQCLPSCNSPQACAELFSRKNKLSALLGAVQAVSHKTDHFYNLYQEGAFSHSIALLICSSSSVQRVQRARRLHPFWGRWDQHQPFRSKEGARPCCSLCDNILPLSSVFRGA